MPRHLKTLFAVLYACWLVLACSANSQKSEYASVSNQELTELQKAELEAFVNQKLEKRDENGNIQELEGFNKNSKLDTDSSLLADESFRDLSQSEEQVFEFTPPDGIEAEFSEPVMVSGAALLLTANDLKAKCGDLAYQAEEPTMKDIIEHSKKTNTCGNVEVNFCIRLKIAKQINPENPNYTYTESPSLNFDLPCPGNSFADLGISIANGKSHTSRSSEKIKISALRSVVSVYLTNTPACLEGGEWQYIGREDPDWTLEFTDNTATVYAKFKDVFGAESECISDSIGYGSTTEQCFANDPSFLAENILEGVSIGDVTGTASLNYPVCTSDGQVGCIAKSSYKAASADSIANKVISGQTAGGVAGSAAIETHSDCTAGGQADCITTTTYKSMDLSSKDAGGAIDITNALFSARIKSASTFEFWDETGTRFTAEGDTDIVEANLLDSVEIFGITGNAGASPDCSSIAVGGTWVLVPGDPDYGTNDFCVMKYEAKCSLADGTTCTASMSSESPTSTAAGTPWVNIDQYDSITECASLGKGFHLINNDEWMTIAANLANVGSNWSSGTVGTGNLFRGHSDNSPSDKCAADADDSKAYVETDCTAQASGGTENDEGTQRRTFTLSNGSVIWDLAGNVWEYTRDYNEKDKPSDDGTPDDDWREYTTISFNLDTMALSDLIPTNALKSYWNDSWSSTQGIGQYYAGANSAGGSIRRGGESSVGANSGAFALRTSGHPGVANTQIGFRCTVAVP